MSQCYGEDMIIECKPGSMIRVITAFYRQSVHCPGGYHSIYCIQEETHNPPCVGQQQCAFTAPWVFLSSDCAYSNDFQITYECIPDNYHNNVCQENKITEQNGYLTSPNYPDKYPLLTSCSISIEVKPHQKIRVYLLDVYLAYLKTDSRIICIDHVVISDSLHKTEKLCRGKRRGVAFFSENNQISVTFHSDKHEIGNSKGFWLYYEAFPLTDGHAKERVGYQEWRRLLLSNQTQPAFDIPHSNSNARTVAVYDTLLGIKSTRERHNSTALGDLTLEGVPVHGLEHYTRKTSGRAAAAVGMEAEVGADPEPTGSPAQNMTGAIVTSTVVGLIVFAMLIAMIIYLWFKKRKEGHQIDEQFHKDIIWAYDPPKSDQPVQVSFENPNYSPSTLWHDNPTLRAMQNCNPSHNPNLVYASPMEDKNTGNISTTRSTGAIYAKPNKLGKKPLTFSGVPWNFQSTGAVNNNQATKDERTLSEDFFIPPVPVKMAAANQRYSPVPEEIIDLDEVLKQQEEEEEEYHNNREDCSSVSSASSWEYSETRSEINSYAGSSPMAPRKLCEDGEFVKEDKNKILTAPRSPRHSRSPSLVEQMEVFYSGLSNAPVPLDIVTTSTDEELDEDNMHETFFGNVCGINDGFLDDSNSNSYSDNSHDSDSQNEMDSDELDREASN
ncbi:uncharacterized protein LOC106154087 [Lingula anatina]|uniref:Uncharacterized protein LOC106154087 n=1 Tax=Lingula anatina TaxID=7574 RepID=A0A1S3HCL4_LINAN|nr:uncharacterized protein LOC106154087 [Lingula anatina]|eukprot:XP_013383777.1 uncharacterized protein LOC106154087 [Lingula anatina]